MLQFKLIDVGVGVGMDIMDKAEAVVVVAIILGIEVIIICDAPNPGCPLTTRQPAENLYVLYHETHT